MGVTDRATFIDDDLCRHASQLEQVYLLPIEFEHAVLRVGQAGEVQAVLTEIHAEGLGIFRAHNEDLSLPFVEFIEVTAQLRHMRLAERSHEGAVEDQHNVLAAQVRKANRFASIVWEFEIGGRGVEGNFGHNFTFLPRWAILVFLGALCGESGTDIFQELLHRLHEQVGAFLMWHMTGLRDDHKIRV